MILLTTMAKNVLIVLFQVSGITIKSNAKLAHKMDSMIPQIRSAKSAQKDLSLIKEITSVSKLTNSHQLQLAQVINPSLMEKHAFLAIFQSTGIMIILTVKIVLKVKIMWLMRKNVWNVKMDSSMILASMSVWRSLKIQLWVNQNVQKIYHISMDKNV